MHLDGKGCFRHDGQKVYVGYAFAGHDIGLQWDNDGFVLWFFTHPIGRFVPGTDYTVQPLPFEFCHPSQVGS